MLLVCDCLVADKPTLNGRVYPHSLLRAAVKDFNQKHPPNRNLLGVCCQEVTTLGLDLHHVVLTAESPLRLKDKHRRMELDVRWLDTPLAKKVEAKLEERLTRLDLVPIVIGEVNSENVVTAMEIVRFDVIVVVSNCWSGQDSAWDPTEDVCG